METSVPSRLYVVRQVIGGGHSVHLYHLSRESSGPRRARVYNCFIHTSERVKCKLFSVAYSTAVWNRALEHICICFFTSVQLLCTYSWNIDVEDEDVLERRAYNNWACAPGPVDQAKNNICWYVGVYVRVCMLRKIQEVRELVRLAKDIYINSIYGFTVLRRDSSLSDQLMHCDHLTHVNRSPYSRLWRVYCFTHILKDICWPWVLEKKGVRWFLSRGTIHMLLYCSCLIDWEITWQIRVEFFYSNMTFFFLINFYGIMSIWSSIRTLQLRSLSRKMLL